ncbi:MAG: CoA transferase [Acidimicrobiaceae bacterium]|nr:CoA transferase [Acidimicrobiaceae bacterium]
MNSEMPMPLTGIRVLDASTILAGPLCCRILGDYGADVIKIESPGAGDSMRGHGHDVDGVSLWWKEISRNKRTVGIDLRTKGGAEVFRKLASVSDVIVENFRPGTLEKWNLSPQSLREVNPGLVVLRLTGFGQSGPYSSRPGFGTLAEAMSGFAHMTGEQDGPPTLPSFGLADSICAMAGVSAILMALRYRELVSRVGQDIDLNILEPILTAVGPAPSVYHHTGVIEGRHGNRSTNNAPRNTYLTRDGYWVAVSASALNVAKRVMELVGHPEIAEEPWFATGRGRVEHVDLIDKLVGGWISTHDRDDVLKAFEKAEAAIAPVLDAKGIVEDPHIRATEMLVEVPDQDLGTVLMHNVLWRMSDTPGQIRFTGRKLGQDTKEILCTELGFTDEEFDNLVAEGAIG